MTTHLTYFTAPWCQPCKKLRPRVEKAAQERGLPLTVVDIDKDPDLAMSVGVMSVPTLLIAHRDEYLTLNERGITKLDKMLDGLLSEES